jgi:transcriptional regulator with XRE-family HTH domain
MANLFLIRDLCKKRGITLSKLAQDLGISFSGLQGIIANNSTKIETLEKIADYLQVPVSYFFTNDPQGRIVFSDDDYEEINKGIEMNGLEQYRNKILSSLSFISKTDKGGKEKNKEIFITKEGLINQVFVSFIEMEELKKETESLRKALAQNEKIIDLLYDNLKGKKE